MKLVRKVVLVALVLALSAFGAGVAAAATVEECQAELATLRADTLAAEGSFTSAKDVAGLVAKVDAAATKLAAGKNTDAVLKLVDFQATLNALATAPKPKADPAVASALGAEAQAAIDCINGVASA